MSGSNSSQDDDVGSLDFATTSTDPLANSLIKAGLPAAEPQDTGPVYRVMGDSKIAVSKQRGKLWKSRRKTGQQFMKDHVDAWDEAIRYYNHDQSTHRDGNDPGIANNRNLAKRLNDRFTSTENIVFSNVSASVPQLYAKNPIVSLTSGINQDSALKDANDAFARAVEKLINTLFTMSHSPGVNAKPKMKRATVVALLTNACWLEVGYTNKDQSSEQALQTLMDVSKELGEAKTVNEITEAEGKLLALEEKIEFLNPSGPFLRVRLPHQVIVDPDHNDSNGADANWIIIDDMMPTDYLNAVYGKTDGDDDEVKSIYEPTHILDGNKDEEEENFSLFSSKLDYNAYGFTDATTFHKAKRTKVCLVWDRVTRRLELYAENNWTWPVWVWDDPYQLQGFFPLTKLWFHENPIATYAKGEVSYYLDQQDQINEINDEKRRSLLWARRNIFYNKNKTTQAEVDKVLKGNDATATGLDLADGVKASDVIFTIPPPSVAFAQMFDKTDLYKAVDRIAATNEVSRGGEFKTNTTNKAVDYYATQGNQRNDERLDAIEDCIGRVGWQIAQLCLRFMQPDQVQQLTGLDVSQSWKPLDPLGDINRWAMTCVGGSTQKQTSSAKKQEAVQIGQVLSQFVKAAPAAVLTKTLEVFAAAFDDVIMEKEDWDKIEQEVVKTLTMSQGGAPGQNQAGGPGQPQPGAPMPGGPPSQPPQAPPQMAQMIVQALSSLPPPVLKAIGAALAQGIPPAQVMQQLQQSSQGAA
jgi:hypothetical protein